MVFLTSYFGADNALTALISSNKQLKSVSKLNIVEGTMMPLIAQIINPKRIVDFPFNPYILTRSLESRLVFMFNRYEVPSVEPRPVNHKHNHLFSAKAP